MKPFNLLGKTLPSAALFLAIGSACFGQLPNLGGTQGSMGLDFALLSGLYGDVTAFTAKAEVRVYGKDKKEKSVTPFDFAQLDNKVRAEVEMSKMVNKDVPEAAAGALKQMGIDRVISISRQDKKATYVIVPGIQSYVNMPMSKEEIESAEAKPKVEKTELGKETLDGHACVKNKVIITDNKGEKHESTVWFATDLKDFPVQVLTKEKDDTVIMRYRQVQFTKPDAKQFDTPAGYQEFNDMQAMMMAAAMKMINSDGAPATK